MKSLSKLASGVIASTALMAAAPASATMLVATYTGTISNGHDYTGVFGAANSNLTGDSYTAIYLIDTTKGYQSYSGGIDTAEGGSSTAHPGLGNPIVSSSVTINGITQTLTPLYDDYTQAGGAAPGPFIEQYGNNSSTGLYQLLYSYADNITTVTSIDQTLPLTSVTGSLGGEFDIDNGASTPVYSVFAYFGLNGTVEIAPVPEPASWAIMVSGVGLTIAAARAGRRRRTLAAARA
jgi:hypothetical protein